MMRTKMGGKLITPTVPRWRSTARPSGNTREEALQRIQEVVQMIVQELIEEGALFPEGPLQDVEVFSEPRVAVTV